MDFWRRKSALWLQRAACAASVEGEEVSGYSRSLGVQWMMSGSSSKSNFPNIRLLLSIKKEDNSLSDLVNPSWNIKGFTACGDFPRRTSCDSTVLCPAADTAG